MRRDQARRTSVGQHAGGDFEEDNGWPKAGVNEHYLREAKSSDSNHGT